MHVGLLPLILCIITVGGRRITLDGIWTGYIQTCDDGYLHKCDSEITFPAVVPGGIYTDLLRVNAVPENLVGRNDINNRWIGNQTVTYIRSFNANDSFVDGSKVILTFHGLDTFAAIFLNGAKIGEASNMFVKYNFDVKRYIKVGKNDLKVVFYSAVKVSEKLYNEQKRNYIVPPKCVPQEYNGECHVNHIRKMQASFSWDWGPAFPSMGIWKSIELISVDKALVTDVTTDVSKGAKTWEITATIFFEFPSDGKNETIDFHLSSTLYIGDGVSVDNTTDVLLLNNKTDGNLSITLSVPVALVHEWWPNGYGEQNLYKLTIIVKMSNDVIAYRNTNIGFRTVELVQEPIKKGLSFYFRINGVPIFAKGSNFIPASVFPELTADEDTIRHLLISAKVAHMNMLRVWGGGVYESDLFYDLADEFGIMIWQDFMFACAMYPTTEQFLESVREEITQNVRRLKNHPSIVLWAGNNENEAALYGNWYGTGDSSVYRDDYIKLYVNLIKDEMEKLDPVRPFVVSSPSNGVYTEEYNFTGQNPYSNVYGDVHYYNYLKNGWNIDQYPRTRFASEYGFQSLPSIYTLITAAETPEDLRINSEFIKHRQHLPLGNPLMSALISKNLPLPRTNNTIKDFMNFIYLSQINQAVSVKIQTESYRQAMSELNTLGEGMTMGALYWQLNDVWQAPSWSSIEFGGRWKMLHYYAIDFFAPIIVTSHLSESNELYLYVVSDKLQTIPNGSVKLAVYNWNSLIPIHMLSFDGITIGPNQSTRVGSMWLNVFLARAGCGPLASASKHCIVTLVLNDDYGFPIAPRNYVYPTNLKDVNLPVANVTVKVDAHNSSEKLSRHSDFGIVIETSDIALFVWLEVRDINGRFSENGFHMFERQKRIVFHAFEAVTPVVLQNNLRVTTLSDIHNPHRFNSAFLY